MDREAILSYFQETLQSDQNVSEAVAAIQTLIQVITEDKSSTLVELRKNLSSAIDILTKTDHGLITSITSGCEMFLRFITLTEALHIPDIRECKNEIAKRGNIFLTNLSTSRKKIANLAHPFITDGATILTHSKSRVVLEVLKEAMLAKKRFKVYVTQSHPDESGIQMGKDLENLGIPTVVILDAAVGYIMEKIDLVIVGAEGVVESGGIINKIGTYTMALSAKEMNKPFYVVAESFKFARLYPLNQADVPNEFKYQASKLNSKSDLSREHPMVDYTPPQYLTLLYTDLGILTPSAISDELIKLYL